MENTKKEIPVCRKCRLEINNSPAHEDLICMNCESSLPSEERKTAEEIIIKTFEPYGQFELLEDVVEGFKQDDIQSLALLREACKEINSKLSEASQQTEAMAKEIEELKEQMEVVVARFTNIQVNLEYDLSEAKKEIEAGKKDLDVLAEGFVRRGNELSAMRERVEKQQWIKTEDQKPNDMETVLVWCRIYGRFTASYKRFEDAPAFGEWCDQVRCGILPPIYWMPLPEPPQSLNPTKQD